MARSKQAEIEDQESKLVEFHRLFQRAVLMWAGLFTVLAILDRWVIWQRPLPTIYYLAYGGGASLLLFVAYWPGLPRQLGQGYPVLGMILLSLLPIFIQFVLESEPPWLPWEATNPQGSIVLRHLPALLLPTLLAAWLWRWPAILAVCLLISVVQSSLLWLRPSAGAALPTFTSIYMRDFIIFWFGYLVNSLAQQLRRQQADLTRINQKLQEHANVLEYLAVSRERNRLARELHDTLAHTLSGLTVQLETVKAYWSIDTATAQTQLEQALETVRSGLQNTRRALGALRASPLEDMGLELALKQLAQSTALRANLTLTAHIPAITAPLPEHIEQCLYRLAQEAMTNVVAHAQAERLKIELKINRNAVQLLVQDDGVGFDPSQEAPAEHYGIAGIQERVELVNGRLTITSRPGEGTTVCAVIPLEVK